MATENQQNIPEKSTFQVPSDSELFVGNVWEKLSAHNMPVENKKFSRKLTGQISIIQKILIAGIVLIGAILIYVLLKSSSKPLVGTPAGTEIITRLPPAEDTVQKVSQPTQKQLLRSSPTQPLSLKTAETLYLQKDYNRAYAVYDQLCQNLSANTEEDLLRDFLHLQMALCMQKANDSNQADSLFRQVLQSRSPLINTLANYYLCLVEMQQNQYLKAQTSAYQAIALVDAVGFDRDWILSLQRNCHFLAAESVTRYVLSLCDSDKYLPAELWNHSAVADPFANLSEAQLRSLLNSGSEKLSKALLCPRIQRLDGQSNPPRWSVVCNGASIEELLARFAANAAVDINWAAGKTSGFREINDSIRKRPVNLYLPAVTAQQFVTVAAGCTGLLAQLDNSKTVNIFAVDNYTSLSDNISLLNQQAISLWQRFLLAFHSDEYAPQAHFALGLLQAQYNRPSESIAEYKLVANRFSQTPLAPFALIKASRLKTGMCDYSGACEDLRQLIEQYPDNKFVNEACLYLADATMKARLYNEAIRLYSKVYHLSSSLESQTASAIGAAKASYEMKDYQSAEKWLKRYIELAQNSECRDLYSAYFLLGKTNLALAKLQQACEAFKLALSGNLTSEEYVETTLVLAEAQIQQEHFVEALDVLESTRTYQLSEKDSINLLLLKCKTLRAMGLPDEAVTIIGDKAEYASDPCLKAKISFELAKCCIAKENLELAVANLTKVLVVAEPGPLANEITLELASVYLRLGQDSQVISACSKLLSMNPSEQIRKETLKILATAHSRQKNYDQAALILLGKWDSDETPDKKRTFNGPVAADQPISKTQ